MPQENSIHQQLKRLEREQLRRTFETFWRQLEGPELEEEFKFHPERKWPFDFAHKESRVCIDLQGGNWKGGAHVQPARYSEDCLKHNQAVLMGYRVFWFTTDMLATDPAGHLLPVIELIRNAQ